jgi:hypothetical protein
MSDRPADEKLRQAFQALGGTSASECSDEELDRIWRAVSGELPAAERRELVARMATDPAFAEAWRVAEELWRASREEVQAGAEGGVRPWTRSWFAAAAVLLLAVGAGLVVRFASMAGDEFRDPGRYVVESLVTPDATLSRDAFRLRWTPGPQGSRYDVRVTTEDLRPLATVTDLTTPELVVEGDRLSTVASGARILWQVEVALPEGERVSSQTFVARVD